MKLVICIPCSWDRVPRAFFQSYINFEIPKDIEVKTLIRTDVPLDLCRNELASRALDMKADYLLWLDADMTHPKDTIQKLLDCKTEVATGVYYRKKAPHYPVVGNYTPWMPEMELYRRTLEQRGFMKGNEQTLFYKPITGKDRPFYCDVSGMGCVLMASGVLLGIESPWFRYYNGHQDGDHTLGQISEEMKLWSDFKKLGIRTLCQPAVRCGHLVEKTITHEDFVPDKELQCV